VDGLAGGHIESSLSAYYYTKVGNVFTGALCVIGVFLLAYRLTAWAIDNIATALAGLSALGVAFVHATPDHATLSQLRLADAHLACATALFVLLGAVSLFIFPRDVVPEQRWRANWYTALGALIWLSIILMPTLSWLASSFYNNDHVFFILETVCVMAFAVSFILKGHGQPGDRGLDRAVGQPPDTAIHPPADADTAHKRFRDSLPGSLNANLAKEIIEFPFSGPRASVRSWDVRS
jgi:hypothetical protein